MHGNLCLTLHYGLTIFLGAFLLFQVQPLIGKMILPWFGGAASVWTTCMLFFQMLLLLGYLYSHWIVRFLSARGQSFLHIGLLGASLLSLPLGVAADWRPAGAGNPTLQILGLLTFSIGLPYFTLSTTGPLIQAWFAREQRGAVPYRLFALSNFGSLLALLSYPALVEPLLGTGRQSWLWSGTFVCFAVSCALLAWGGRYREAEPQAPQPSQATPAPQGGDRLMWALLAACPSILLIADTSYLTENVAPIPLLWVVPLALYLLSFILCFESRRWYRRRVFFVLLPVALGVLAYLPTLRIGALPLLVAMGVNLFSFFVVCMVCHGELALRQPHPAHLTGYYLMLALGGACGGIFVGFVAPYWFDGNYEFSAGLVATAAVVSFAALHRRVFASRRRSAAAWGVALGLVASIAWTRIEDHLAELAGARFVGRNFYGTLRVRDGGKGPNAYRLLLHGRIKHGVQLTAPERLDTATTYYDAASGVGRALTVAARQGPMRVGVVGLGAGTLATYGRSGDAFRFYEINPRVIDVARREFSFLSRSRATLETVLGDARLVLERETAQGFDLLALDAFSGDSVPIHLLTREAFAQYLRHLKPNGVLAVHVSNQFLHLDPVVRAAADSFGRHARLIVSAGDDAETSYRSSWVLVAADRRFFDEPEIRDATEIAMPEDFRLWRDDYSSVFAVLK